MGRASKINDDIKVADPVEKGRKPKKTKPSMLRVKSDSDSEEEHMTVIEPPIKKTRKPRAKRDPDAPKKPKTAWMLFVDEYRLEHPELSYKAALREASASYKKSKENVEVSV